MFNFRAIDGATRKRWKMREYHVNFLYYAYAIFEPFHNNFTCRAKQIFTAMKHLIRALYLTKGFSTQVRKKINDCKVYIYIC